VEIGGIIQRVNPFESFDYFLRKIRELNGDTKCGIISLTF